MGKVTINALKKKGLTGEELRCLMWGRESINTPIKLKKPPKDPLLNPQGPDLTGGFGDALTTALDVMAFTHDLDIVGASQGLNLANNPKPTNTNKNIKVTSKVSTPLPPAGADISMMNTLSKLTESQVPVIPNSASVEIKVTNPEDPFRELVINEQNGDCDPEKLKFLALSAASLKHSEEIPVVKEQTKSVKNLAGIFAGTETFVRKIEETVKKKYSALDPSDSEGFGGVFFTISAHISPIFCRSAFIGKSCKK